MTGLDRYFRTVEDVDAQGASDFVLELLDEGMPLMQITADVLGPAQVRVGERWEQGQWTVADEHAATAVTETALAALTHAGRARPGPGPEARHVLLVCAEGEWHSLPARMVAAMGSTGHLRITVMGPSLPADQLARRLEAGDVDLLALSCTIPSNLLGAARCVEAAHARDIPVIAGGRAFGVDSHRASAIGADAWGASGAALLSEVPPLAGRTCAIPQEVLLLDAVDAATVALAYDAIVACFPRLSAQTAYQRDRTQDDLRWMARFAAAAILTDDLGVLDELVDWLCRLLGGRVPEAVITTSADLLADQVEHFAPRAATALRAAAGRRASRIGAA